MSLNFFKNIPANTPVYFQAMDEKALNNDYLIRNKNDNLLEECSQDSYSRINFDLYLKIWKAKGKPSHQITLNEEHPLWGKQLRSKKTGKVYNIERIYKQWYWGWTIRVLAECNKSHACFPWEDISSDCADTIRAIKECREDLEIV